MTRPQMRIAATVLGAPDPKALGAFYASLLGWTVVDNQDDWVKIEPPSGGTGLSFQYERHWVTPIWPAAPGKQQMTSHLDIAVDDLAAGVAWALAAGATLADFQPQEDVRVMRDPAGHPFCLFVAGT